MYIRNDILRYATADARSIGYEAKRRLGRLGQRESVKLLLLFANSATVAEGKAV